VLSERAIEQDVAAPRFAGDASRLGAGDPREESSLSVTVEELEDYSLIRLDCASTLACAEELKRLLLHCLASGGDLRLDLGRVEEIDITGMQLLWAAGREAERAGAAIAVRMSEAAATAVREAGFGQIPGLTVQGDGWPK
jgi:anti-anti-sigma regulatory factor